MLTVSQAHLVSLTIEDIEAQTAAIYCCLVSTGLCC